MSWVYLDDHFPDHPKVVAAGGDAAWLFVCSLAYVKRYETEGFVPGPQVQRLTDRSKPAQLAARLIEVGLWEEDGTDYRIHDYHEWNKPADARKKAARKAAQARWDAERNANASESHSERIEDADASTCPPPYPHPHPPSSNSHSSSSSTDGDEDERVTAALEAVARRRLAQAGNVKSRARWLAAVGRNMRDEELLDVEALKLLEEYPELTAGQLVDVLMGNRSVLRFVARKEAM